MTALAAPAGSTDLAGTLVTVVFVLVAIGIIGLMYLQLRRVPRKFDPTLQDRTRRRRKKPPA